jgi:hypothetical protein
MKDILMSNLAIIANSTDFSQLYTTLSPAGPNIARLRINRDSSVEGSDGSLLTVPAPSLALRDTDDSEIYSNDCYLRVYLDTMQTAVFDSDAEEYTNMSSHFRDFSKPALDWFGGDKCGWMSSKAREKLRTEDPVAFATASKVKLYRHVYGTVRMVGAVDPSTGGTKDIDDVPFRLRLGPSNFMEIGNVIGGIVKQGVNPASVELKIDFELKKRGSNKWFNLKYKPIMTNIIELDSDYRELLSDFAQLVKVENEQILEKMRENASDAVDEFDDVLEA